MPHSHALELVAQGMLYDAVMAKHRYTPISSKDGFGRRLRILRTDLNMTQTELRNEMERRFAVGVGQNHISDLERADSMPSLQVAAAIAQVLGTSIDYLAGITDDPAPNAKNESAPSYISPEADQVAQQVDQLTPEQRQATLDLMLSITAREQKRRADAYTEFQKVMGLIEDIVGPDVRRRIDAELRRRFTPGFE